MSPNAIQTIAIHYIYIYLVWFPAMTKKSQDFGSVTHLIVRDISKGDQMYDAGKAPGHCLVLAFWFTRWGTITVILSNRYQGTAKCCQPI